MIALKRLVFLGVRALYGVLDVAFRLSVGFFCWALYFFVAVGNDFYGPALSVASWVRVHVFR